jgi:hypothetical protein
MDCALGAVARVLISHDRMMTKRVLIEYFLRILSARRWLIVTTRSRRLGEDLVEDESYIYVPPSTSVEGKHLLRLRLRGETNIPFRFQLREVAQSLGIHTARHCSSCCFYQLESNIHTEILDCFRGKSILSQVLSARNCQISERTVTTNMRSSARGKYPLI